MLYVDVCVEHQYRNAQKELKYFVSCLILYKKLKKCLFQLK